MNAKATSLLVGGLTVALFTVAAAAGEATTVASARSDAHAARAVVAPAPAGRYGYVAGGRLLSVIDAANPAIVARIALGAGATGTLAAHPAGTLVYVVTDDAIAAVDTRSRTVVATVPADGVGALLVHPDGSRLYAAGRIALAGAAARPSLLVIDTQTNAVTANLALPAASSASGMTMLPDGSRLYVANRFSGCCDGSVSILDTATQQITTEIPLAVRGPLTADPTGASVYAASAGGISIIDTATDAVTATLPFSPEPFPTIVASAIAFDPPGAHAYVATYSTGAGFGGSDGWVRVIDTARQAFVVNIELDQIPTAMVLNPSGSRIYVSGQVPGLAARPTQVRPAGVAVIDALTRGVIATVPPVSPEPYTVVPASLAFNAATGAVYALDSSTTYVIDAATNGISATLPPGAALAFAPDAPPVPGRLWHYLLDSRSGAYTALQWGAPGDAAVAADYDGDARADVAILRPREGGEEALWYVKRSGDGGVVRRQWGAVSLGDVPVPADYDGDHRADFAVWRPALGEWFILRSTDGGVAYWRFGHPTDLPVPADYDGDGRADLATYDAGTWLMFGSTVGVTTVTLGAGLDVPVPADYDGDGRADAAVFHPITGEWRIQQSGAPLLRSAQWGLPGDVPVPADYDGDGKADVAVWRPATGTWWIVGSRNGEVVSTTWGAAGDRTEPADYDGDRRADPGVYRP